MTVENLTLPKARIVQGNPCTAYNITNMVTKQPELDAQGNPKKEWRVSLAIPKADFVAQVLPHIQREVALTHPHLAALPVEQMMGQRYSFKVIDGDSPMCPQGGKTPYNQREGYPGCYVIKLSTQAFAPGVVAWKNGKYENVGELEIKTGDYVLANINLKSHGSQDGGLYWNPNIFNLVEYGQPISSNAGGVDPTTAFGAQGVEVVGNPMMGVTQPAPMMQQAPVVQPAPMMQQAPVVQPAHDFVQNALGNGQPVQPVVNQQPVTHPMGMPTAAPATLSTTDNMFPTR